MNKMDQQTISLTTVQGDPLLRDNDERVKEVENFLNEFLKPECDDQRRICTARARCCGSSRSLYCTECYSLIIPKDEWPTSIKNSELKLPFNVTCILDDRRKSSTGLHLPVLLRASGHGDQISIADLDRGEVPSICDMDSTYLLFPQKGVSKPLSSVADKVKNLVVLDCKWTSSQFSRELPVIQDLPKVHLTTPPKESFYWRWHNAGQGMLSTLEAIYFASMELKQIKEKNDEKENHMLDLLWLFGIQRASTVLTACKLGKPIPFTSEGKEMQRSLRRTIKGSESHLRDIERGRQLKEANQKMKSNNNSSDTFPSQLTQSSQ